MKFRVDYKNRADGEIITRSVELSHDEVVKSEKYRDPSEFAQFLATTHAVRETPDGFAPIGRPLAMAQ